MSRDMTNSEAISNLNHIYGFVSPNIQRSLDVAFKAMERPQGDLKSCEALKAYAREVLCGDNPTNSLLIRMFDEIIDNTPPVSERSQCEWIPVSERLPIRNGVYIVTRIIEGTRITDASYFDGQNTWHRDVGVNHGRPYLNDVIAWQPRPEPYKEGGADMRKPNCVTCDHFGKCEKCEKGDEE